MPLSIFRDMRVFDRSHMPEVFRHREAEMKELASCIHPLVRGAEGEHVLVYGGTATGKTTSVFKLFSELKESAPGVECVYVNTSLMPSANSALSEIFIQLSRQAEPPDKSLGTLKLTRQIMRRLVAKKKPLLLCLDEYLHIPPKQLSTVLAPFLRPAEFSHGSSGSRVSLILVSSKSDLSPLRSSLQSCLAPVHIEYRPYSRGEMTDILNTRAEAGFGPGVVDREALRVLVDSRIDLRQGIRALKLAGECADRRGSDRVTHSDFFNALKRLRTGEAVVDASERQIVQFINSREEATSGDIYEFSWQSLSLGKTAAYNLLKGLLRKGVLEATDSRRRGNTRIFKLASKEVL